MFNYKSAVIIVPERLGDTLFHTPSIRFLRKMRPNMRIEIIALSELAASIFDNNPYVDAVHATPNSDQLQQIASRCEVVLLIHPNKTAQRCAQSVGLPIITAESVPQIHHATELSQAFFRQLLDEEIEPSEKHYTLFPIESNRTKIATLLRESGVDMTRDILIGCHIGCHGIAKKSWRFWKNATHPKVWPLENFVALSAMLRQTDARFRLVLTGSSGEARLGTRFEQAEPSAINLIGKTSVTDMAALMASLHLFITSDTGALHTACATDVSLIALFGPTDPIVTGPYPPRPQHRVLQAQHMRDIAPATVHDVILNHPSIQNVMLSNPQILTA